MDVLINSLPVHGTGSKKKKVVKFAQPVNRAQTISRIRAISRLGGGTLSKSPPGVSYVFLVSPPPPQTTGVLTTFSLLYG